MIDPTTAAAPPASNRPANGDPGTGLRAWVGRELAWGRLLPLGAITAQLALLVGILKLYNLETQALEKVAVLVLGGFLVHHFLPLRLRLPAFALLSVASVLMVLGGRAGLALLGSGAVLIALCHVPAPMGVRVALVLGAGGLLAVVRAAPSWLPSSLHHLLPGSFWPILGSMFMFRLMLYIYDLRHRTAPTGPWRALAYFFMIPNVCFPLFPVVDYQMFNRNHYNDDPIRIYQIGTRWILRGLVQLLLYRLVYRVCMIDVGNIRDALDVGQYMLTTFLLYLKISGTFHLVVGMLHLFGFNLPETHHLYLLSSSFTDFWRRINIYWKDFITKLVFYPLYFQWKRLGDARAVVLATLGAFFTTWALHSYQWFWIRGRFPIVWSDVVFWFGLGVVVVLNVRWEQRRGRRRTLKKAVRNVKGDIGLALRTAGTFTTICALWTIWSTPDLQEIRTLLAAATHITWAQAGIILTVPIGIGIGAVVLGGRAREHTEGVRASVVRAGESLWPASLKVAAAAATLLLVGLKPWLLSEPQLVAVAADMKIRGLSKADEQRLHRGYYEELGDVTRFDNELWRMYGLAPKDWGTEMTLNEDRKDLILFSYMPNLKGPFKGATFTTNSDGLRDREYTREKPRDTFRIALLGSSHDVGSGVETSETYENVAEDLLNTKWRDTGKKFEILNFAAGGYTPVQKLAVSEIRVPEYHPDVVLWVANSNEFDWTFYMLEKLMERKQVSECPYFVEAMEKARIDPNSEPLTRDQLVVRLKPFAHEALGKMLQRFAQNTRSHNSLPVLVLAEYPMDDKRSAAFDDLEKIARDCGMQVIDLYGALASVKDRSKLWIAPWDDHTNAVGHRLLGEKLFERLVEGHFATAGTAGEAATPPAASSGPPPGF